MWMNSFVSDGNGPQRPLPPQTQRVRNRKPGYGHNQRRFKSDEKPLDDESVFTFSSSSQSDRNIMNQYESVLKSINNLKPTYKNILEDRLLNNMKYQDLADKYQLPLQTIKNRIRRGKAIIAANSIK